MKSSLNFGSAHCSRKCDLWAWHGVPASKLLLVKNQKRMAHEVRGRSARCYIVKHDQAHAESEFAMTLYRLQKKEMHVFRS